MILDESGSMKTIRNDILTSVNEFITEHKAQNNDDTFTFVTFSDDVKTRILKKPIKEMELLNQTSYVPTGTTALYKAIVDTVNLFKDDSDVAMVIVTDGQENASPLEYTRQKVFDLVTKHKSQNNWDFNYLSADIDTFGQGVNLGFGITGYDASNNTTSNTAVGYSQISKNIGKCCKTSISKTNTKKAEPKDKTSDITHIDIKI